MCFRTLLLSLMSNSSTCLNVPSSTFDEQEEWFACKLVSQWIERFHGSGSLGELGIWVE